MYISNEDLFKNKHKYTTEELEENLDHLWLKNILATQTLTAEFCVKHMLNAQMPDVDYEEWLYFTDYTVLTRQKHLTEDDLQRARDVLRQQSQ